MLWIARCGGQGTAAAERHYRVMAPASITEFLALEGFSRSDTKM